MTAPMQPIEILSIYFKNHKRLNLPDRMAQCTPDTKRAVFDIRDELSSRGIDLFLSDMFRSREMQQKAHEDNKKKGIFSPLPGSSMHEAGRAFDLDLSALLKGDLLTLAEFWEIASPHGVFPIIGVPDRTKSEAWHFDCRGSHGKVRQYYREGKGGGNMKPYEAMAASAILAIGVKVDRFPNQKVAGIQSALIRLGHELGALDGSMGNKTRDALAAAGVALADESTMLLQLEERLKQTFPEEFQD